MGDDVHVPFPDVRQEGSGAGDHEDQGETVSQPAKVMRIASMVRQLLEEVRHAPLDQASRSRLAEVYETAVRELSEGLSPDLASELGRITGPFETSVPSDAELRVAQAQLVGWLEGLFHGIQATMYAQQMAERSRVEESARRGLPPADDAVLRRPGTYL
ncbi:MAG: proteasome activator [Acidimicrobiales bacterium]